MFTLSSAHAIGFAHSKMAGGWKSALIASAAYFFSVAGFILLTAYATAFNNGRGMSPDFLAIWAAWLLGFQCLVLIIFGSFRVSNCVRRDISTHMIESHRLMPVAAPHAILGYLFHANFQLLAVAAATGLPISCPNCHRRMKDRPRQPKTRAKKPVQRQKTMDRSDLEPYATQDGRRRSSAQPNGEIPA